MKRQTAVIIVEILLIYPYPLTLKANILAKDPDQHPLERNVAVSVIMMLASLLH